MRRISPKPLLLALVLAASPVSAADGVRTAQVAFPAGAEETRISDVIVGSESVSYLVGAEAGQKLRVVLTPSNPATYFNVYEPGNGPGDSSLAIAGLTGPMVPEINHFQATLKTSGVYTISVYMKRSVAQDGAVSTYALDVALTGGRAEVVEGDYADGLMGGPDFWQVHTESATGRLRLRAEPSIGAEVLGLFERGKVLRNHGCRMAEGVRWCEVERPEGGLRGWVAGRYLVEDSDPGAASAE